VANPRQVFDVFTAVREAHPDVTFGAHFHDTRGFAAANTMAALEAGITTFDASVGGLGGSPNAPGAGGTRRPRTWSTCSRRWGSRLG
jgi:hydroxymethylglutaryl-CoA lyase